MEWKEFCKFGFFAYNSVHRNNCSYSNNCHHTSVTEGNSCRLCRIGGAAQCKFLEIIFEGGRKGGREGRREERKKGTRESNIPSIS